MERPHVEEGDWITVGKSNEVVGYVFAVYPDGGLAFGYYQNNAKAIKEDVV